MILIQTQKSDIATAAVIDWIIFFGYEYLRINEDSKIDNVHVDSQNASFCFTDVTGICRTVSINDISAYWYRRGYSNVEMPVLSIGNKTYIDSFNEYYYKESFAVESLTYYFFNHIKGPKIGHIRFNNINKLVILNMAKDVGLDVPDTAIFSSKQNLLVFYRRHQENGIITKALNQSFGMQDNENGISIAGYTAVFSNDHFSQCPEAFFPTLFQEAIPKKFELRIFYLNGKFFSSAIFSQNDDRTKVDFRKYNFEKPSRTPPFKLPEHIESKLASLMQKMELNSGSIDMIYSKTGEYIFLEVNPVGQFWQVSYPCNYYLEREIAKALCE